MSRDSEHAIDRDSAGPRRGWAAGVACGLFAASALVYNMNFREVSEDDTLAVRFLPLSMLHEGDTDLDEFPILYRGKRPLPYYLKAVGGHYYSRSPFMPAAMALPVYWLAEKGGLLDRTGKDLEHAVTFASKIAASLMAAASVAVMFLALLAVSTPRRAVALALVYAFATNTWAVSSQGLWQHAPSQLCIALAWLFLLPRGAACDRSRSRPPYGETAGRMGGESKCESPRMLAHAATAAADRSRSRQAAGRTEEESKCESPRMLAHAATSRMLAHAATSRTLAHAATAWAGLAMGFAFTVRPASLPLALVAFGYAAWRSRRAWWVFALGFAIPAVPVLVYNYQVFGALSGGYADLTHMHPRLGRIQNPWGGDMADGLLGLLFSPNRGLLVYTPVCFFSIVGAVHWWRRDKATALALSLSVIVVLVIGSRFIFWWAGWSFGPRYLMDPIPLLVLLMAPVRGLLDWRRWGVPFGVLTAWSVAVQMVGFWCYPADWNTRPVNVDLRPERLWDWRDTQLRRCLTAGPRPTLWQEWARDLSNRAVELYDAGLFDQAAAQARRAIKMNPSDARAHNTLGNVQVMRRRLDLAETHYRAALKCDPEYALAHSNLAVCLMHTNRADEARRHIERAIQLDPELAAAYRALGDLHVLAGRKAEAAAAYRKALQLAPTDSATQRRLEALRRGH